MGLTFTGGLEALQDANIPAAVEFLISGGGSGSGSTVGDRPRRVHINVKNRNGERVGRVSLPFFLSNSSLGHSSTLTSALTSGTTSGDEIGQYRQLEITSSGGYEQIVSGRVGILGTTAGGHVRLNVSNASNVPVGRRHIVIQLPNGNRAISQRIVLSS